MRVVKCEMKKAVLGLLFLFFYEKSCICRKKAVPLRLNCVYVRVR